MSERFREPTRKDIEIYFDPEWIHYTASISPPRPSLGLFSATLEFQFFSPGTPENENYKILTTGWLHDSVWMTISIPTAKKHLAEAVAKHVGLRILETIPVACIKFPAFATVGMEAWEQLQDVDPKWEPFPLHKGINMFCLENTKDHPVQSKKMTLNEWIEYEVDVVRKIAGNPEWTEEDQEEMKKFKDFMKS